jgi:8-oxo-dGTP diphosphatase
MEVTCGIILQNEKILVTQRSEKMKLPLKWEFPGGKIELGETPERTIPNQASKMLEGVTTIPQGSSFK